ncbi:MAG: McrC family protein [Gemmataceae bacterium]
MPPLVDTLASELTLFEYGTGSEGTALFDHRESLHLQAYLAKGWLTRYFDGEQPCLRASHYVGLLPFTDGDRTHLLMIAPKGCRQNWKDGILRFLELIALGNGEKPPEDLPGLEGQKGPQLFLLFLAHHYAGLLKELCLRDFRSYYRPEEDELRSRIRGRLHVARYARLAVRGKPHILPCRWDEFTVDNWDNRILWAAARRLKQIAGHLAPEAAAWVWQPFKGLLPWFSAVAEVPITVHDLRKSRLGRTSRYYRHALAWAELLLRGSDVPTAGGQAPPLVLDSNKAFEKFAAVVARAALPDAAEWQCDFQKRLPFLEGELIQKRKRKPDILLAESRAIRSRGEAKYKAVGDAKYKKVLERVDSAALESVEELLKVGILSADWNQLYVYMRISGATCGFFIVPFWKAKGDHIAWRDNFQFVESPRDGNMKVRLAVLGLNLLQPLQKVKEEAADRLRSWLSKS